MVRAILCTILMVTTSLVDAELPRFQAIAQPVIEFEINAKQAGAVEYDRAEGEIVPEGKAIAHVDGSKQKLELDIAQAAVIEAQSDYGQRKDDRADDETLFSTGAVSSDAVEKAVAAERSSEARLSRSLTTAALRQRDLVDTKFVAPTNVVFVEKLANDYSQVSSGQAIARVMNADRIVVEVYPSFKLFNAVSLGDAFTIWEPSLKVSLTGYVTYIAPKVDSATGTFRLKIEAENVKDSAAADIRERYKVIPGCVVEVFRSRAPAG